MLLVIAWIALFFVHNRAAAELVWILIATISLPYAENVSAVAKEWNKFRETIIMELLEKHLLPQLEQQAKQKLYAEAKEAAAKE